VDQGLKGVQRRVCRQIFVQEGAAAGSLTKGGEAMSKGLLNIDVIYASTEVLI
jgi:hypothetical protein